MIYPFKVNGGEMNMTQEKSSITTYWNPAEKHGALPGKVEGYTREGEVGHHYGQDDLVGLSADKSFITLLRFLLICGVGLFGLCVVVPTS